MAGRVEERGGSRLAILDDDFLTLSSKREWFVSNLVCLWIVHHRRQRAQYFASTFAKTAQAPSRLLLSRLLLYSPLPEVLAIIAQEQTVSSPHQNPW